MSRSLVTPTEFAKIAGVSKPAISRAIKIGRVRIYDETGKRVAPTFDGQKFIDVDESRSQFSVDKRRIDASLEAKISADIERDIAEDAAALVRREKARPARKKAVADDAQGALPLPVTLNDAKIEKEGLQSELLRLRIARERGEMVMRSSQLAAFETAGRNVARAAQAMPTWAEELNAVAHKGGVPALMAWLRAKSVDFCERVADMMSEDGGEDSDDGAGED